jgi:hypothetical protein
MTPIRWTVLVVSLLGMLLFGFLVFWTSSFYIQLIAFFFFFLSLFHAGLSAWVGITKRKAKASATTIAMHIQKHTKVLLMNAPCR